MSPHRLTLDADLLLTDVVRLFIERAATPAIGAEDAQELARAGEETFTYVAEQSPGTSVRFILDPRPYAALLDIAFDGVNFSPAMFNITRTVDLDDDALMDLPLLLAARSVDRFDLDVQPGEPVRIRLQKDRFYPPLPPVQPPLVTGEGAFVTSIATPELLRYFACLLAETLGVEKLPEYARNGDRLADLVAAGEMSGVLAVNGEGQIGGGLLWGVTGKARVASFYGPYILAESNRAAIATDLVEALIAAISRSPLNGLFSRNVTDDLPEEYFEPLGDLLPAAPGLPPIRAVYRGLDEDNAAAVWADPAILDDLEERYARFALAREIRPVRPPVTGSSVLAVGFDRARGSATLRPVLSGIDAVENVAAHVALLAEEPILLAELDLGRSIDATFIPALLAAGFETRFVVPSVGVGDVLILQRPLS